MKVAILSRQDAIRADQNIVKIKPKEKIYFISIVDPNKENPEFASANQQLNLKFGDNLADPRLEHAVELVDFISKIPKDNSFLVVHCEQGISRSAAVGLFAYAFHYGIDETRNEFKDFFNRIQPNDQISKLMDWYGTSNYDAPFYQNEFYDFVKEINTMDVYGLEKWI